MGSPMYSLQCRHCLKTFEHLQPNTKFCSPTCRQLSVSAQRAELNAGKATNLCAASVGAMHEMLVCVDLLKRGFNVYRSVSPAAPCDLMVESDRILKSVEVTTGSYTETGRKTWPKKEFSLFDFLAVVMPDGGIDYYPEPPAVPARSSRVLGALETIRKGDFS